MITYKLTLGIGFLSQQEDEITVEEMGYTEDEWNGLTNGEQEDILEEHWKDWMYNHLDGGWQLI